MIFDLERDTPSALPAHDVCIVGAGAVGIVLAVELVRLGRRVLLLEGGGREIESAAQDTYSSEVAGHGHNGIHSGRFRALGGTTLKWGGQILELDEIDFEERPWIAGSGWPIRKRDIDPYYKRALDLEGLGESVSSDDEVWRRLGLEPQRFGDEFDAYFSRWCPEPNFARLYRDALEKNEALTIWLHATACGLALDADGATVRAVRCRTLSGKEAAFSAQRYVFCLGGIETSRFFLQPMENGRIGWSKEGLIGRHFQDHIDCNAAIVRPRDPVRFRAAFDNVFQGGFKYHPKIKLAAKAQESHGTLQIAATMAYAGGGDETMARLKTMAKSILRGRSDDVGRADLAHAAKHLPLLLRSAWRYKVKHRAYHPTDASIAMRLHCEQEPMGESSITLAETRDGFGMFRSRLCWRISALELETMRKFVEMAKDMFHYNGLARLEPDADLMATSSSFAEKCDDSNHHMGGMRMADSPSEGVVDRDLRLHGSRNCFVCSSAVFPSSGFSNPTHTLLALSVRLAEHLAS